MAELPCPTCGSPLTYLEQYQRYYCHRCLQYASEGYGERGAQKCPKCGGILSYVRQYGRLYCYHCNAYAPEEPAAPAAEVTARATVETYGGEDSSPPSTLPATEPIPEGSPTEQPPVVGESSVSVEPAPEAPPQQAKGEEPKPVEHPLTLAPMMEAPPAARLDGAASEKSTEPEPAAPSRAMRALATQKPAAVRVKLFALKKTELIDLCKVYDLEPSGTKEQIQERLLSYLHDLEAEEQPEPEKPERIEPPVLRAESASAPAGEPTTLAAEEPAAPLAAPVMVQAAVPVLIQEPKPEPRPSAVVETAPQGAPILPAPAETSRPTPKVEHPCPICGRELTYIAQYDRSYCYYCQRYAPAAPRPKNACPTCGATMRWIDEHRRWWCESCEKYASADLPAPGARASAQATPTAANANTVSTAHAIVTHQHGSPAAGAGLVGLGLAIYVVYAFFAFLGDMLGFVRPAGISADMLNLIQFFAFLCLALGAIIGLYGLRDHM